MRNIIFYQVYQEKMGYFMRKIKPSVSKSFLFVTRKVFLFWLVNYLLRERVSFSSELTYRFTSGNQFDLTDCMRLQSLYLFFLLYMVRYIPITLCVTGSRIKVTDLYIDFAASCTVLRIHPLLEWFQTAPSLIWLI